MSVGTDSNRHSNWDVYLRAALSKHSVKEAEAEMEKSALREAGALSHGSAVQTEALLSRTLNKGTTLLGTDGRTRHSGH